MSDKKKQTREEGSLEATLDSLSSTIAEMESQEISLEQALEAFERGIGLIKSAQAKLSDAEQSVQLLTEQAEKPAS